MFRASVTESGTYMYGVNYRGAASWMVVVPPMLRSVVAWARGAATMPTE